MELSVRYAAWQGELEQCVRERRKASGYVARLLGVREHELRMRLDEPTDVADPAEQAEKWEDCGEGCWRARRLPALDEASA